MQIQAETAENFIGRKKELATFRSWFLDNDPEAPWILYFYDALEQPEKKGGVGKTSLLLQCERLARDIYTDIVIVKIDFFNIADRDGPSISDRVVKALKAAYPIWQARRYDAQVQSYLENIRLAKENRDEVRSKLADALLADLAELSEYLQKVQKYLLMLFDTYEVIEQNPASAVLRYSQSFPDDYHFERIGVVVAGRNRLDWSQPNWRGREAEVYEVALAPFSEAEMLQYFEQLSTVDQAALKAEAPKLYERTEGRPILVGLVNDVLNRRVISLKELISVSHMQFESSLVAKINDFERPFDTILLYMAHAYHRFNFELLYWLFERTNMSGMLAGIDNDVLKQQLLELSFVRRASTIGDDFVLHDEMRPLINKYCWEKLDPDKRSRKEISKYAISYYEKKLLPPDLSEQLRQAYTVEKLYHELFFDIDSGYQFFEKNFSKAIYLWLSAFARSLLQEAKKFLHEFSVEQQYLLKRYEAQLLQKEERGEEALVLYAQLEQEADPGWIEKQYSDIVYEKGVCYYQLSQYPEAIAAFDKVKELSQAQKNDSDYASMLNWLGATYQRQGQLDTALQYFDESLDIHKRLGNRNAYTSILTSSGSVYRLQGKIDEALRRTKIARRIRIDQFSQGKISEIFVGWSLDAIGIIYMDIDDLVEAEKKFQEALDIFVRIGSKKGLATIYNRFGQLSDAQGKLEEALEWYKKAYTSALGGIDIASQINSLNKQGRVFIQQQRLSAAEASLTDAVELSRQFHDYYQQAESLIDLIEVYKREKQQDSAEKVLQAAESVCRQYNYRYLLGLIYEALGDWALEREEFLKAFHYFGEACHFMALYNSLKYNKFLRKINDILLQIPEEQIVKVTDVLIKYWEIQNMKLEFPELIALCEEVRGLMAI